MIWSCQQESGNGIGELAAYIEAELAAAAPDRPGAARELSLAVEAFIRDNHRDEALASEYLLLLIARALWAIGEETAARRFIKAQGAVWRVAPPFVEAALARDLSVPHWRALLDARVVQSSATLARGAIWIVDIQRLMGPGRGGLELTALRVVNAVIDRIAGVWDHSQGKGILGLRHLDAAAAAVLGCSCRCRKSSDMALEIRSQCVIRLRAAGQSRGWPAVPEVINLDIHGS
ncbi:MAG: hypothetical protein KKG09_11135 [Verrucomicrobia bacterium]|nr:hypothetical protein [Verrucomicrobiota bacterium]MCG2678368.1 hypothetical protein [Kiritimatiellia bacterium]MBU4247349.1 hypothetical protein [Verrucomicrobiota bacterium]MBU4291474.1 hypothetical protein [Verrucomicrobiota bacterium]MBU4428738.1 hypothetical protein [Verrucomicrobiota bacterium]